MGLQGTWWYIAPEYIGMLHYSLIGMQFLTLISIREELHEPLSEVEWILVVQKFKT